MVSNGIVSSWLVHSLLTLSLTCIWGGGRVHYIGSTILFYFQLWENSKADCALLTLVWQPIEKKENYEFKSVKFCIKIDCVTSCWYGEVCKCICIAEKCIIYKELQFYKFNKFYFLTERFFDEQQKLQISFSHEKR